MTIKRRDSTGHKQLVARKRQDAACYKPLVTKIGEMQLVTSNWWKVKDEMNWRKATGDKEKSRNNWERASSLMLSHSESGAKDLL